MTDSQQVIDNQDAIVMRVSNTSVPQAVATAVSARLREGKNVVLHAIGHGAVGQAFKAIPILNTMQVNSGTIYLILPSMEDVEMSDGTKTVMKFRLIPWKVGG